MILLNLTWYQSKIGFNEPFNSGSHWRGFNPIHNFCLEIFFVVFHHKISQWVCQFLFLMVTHCQTLSWSISLLHVWALLMLFILFVNLLSLLPYFIRLLVLYYESIFKTLYFKVFYFYSLPLWRCMHILMLIGSMI